MYSATFEQFWTFFFFCLFQWKKESKSKKLQDLLKICHYWKLPTLLFAIVLVFCVFSVLSGHVIHSLSLKWPPLYASHWVLSFKHSSYFPLQMMCFPKVLIWMCALQIMDIATFYRGNMPAFFTTRYVCTFNGFIAAIFNVHLEVMSFIFFIFYFCPFQNTKHYELLNYSEHGTTVDNVLYSCDFSEKASPTPPSGLVAKVQGIIRESKIMHIVCPCGESDWERVCHYLSRIYLHIYYNIYTLFIQLSPNNVSYKCYTWSFFMNVVSFQFKGEV